MDGLYFQTSRLTTRKWREEDLDDLFALRSNELVMEHFPYVQTKDEVASILNKLILAQEEVGFAFAPVFENASNHFIGFAGIQNVSFETSFTPATEIGWSLLPQYWGNGYATEIAAGWLEFAFMTQKLNEIVSFAVAANTPSHRVMERLKMKRTPKWDFDHPKVPEEKPHLIRHLTWKMTADDWHAMSSTTKN